jgi:hypothetical protein
MLSPTLRVGKDKTPSISTLSSAKRFFSLHFLYRLEWGGLPPLSKAKASF